MSNNEKYLPMLRYDDPDVDVCGECGVCSSGEVCEPARGDLRKYDGVRATSDGFDCALPISIDSHSRCSYGCVYCFADNLIEHREQTTRPLGQTSLGRIERIFAGEGGKNGKLMRKALRYNDRNPNGYPSPVQLGAICDPGDHIERQQGWTKRFIDLCVKYQQPVRISTKGTTFMLPDYLEAFAKAPELFWVTFSIITPDDKLLARLDRRAPSATDRLATMAALSKVGVKTALRLRPMMPRCSDSTPGHPYAYRELIERSAEAGAVALSTEVAFVPGMRNKDVNRRWERLERAIKVPMRKVYDGFGKRAACERPPASWTEAIMHAVREVAHDHGMVVGVSDPVWKQLNDTGCCCGILPDDPVHGNWERRQATNALVEARDTGNPVAAPDGTPPWAHELLMVELASAGVGPLSMWKRLHRTWKDNLVDTWNNLGSERGPLGYFQGALLPKRKRDDGDIEYEYRALERTGRVGAYWKVDPKDAERELSPRVTEYPPGPWQEHMPERVE